MKIISLDRFREPAEKKKPTCADADDSGLSRVFANSSSGGSRAALYTVVLVMAVCLMMASG